MRAQYIHDGAERKCEGRIKRHEGFYPTEKSDTRTKNDGRMAQSRSRA